MILLFIFIFISDGGSGSDTFFAQWLQSNVYVIPDD